MNANSTRVRTQWYGSKLRGDNLSAEIRKFLERYVKKGNK